MIRFQTIVESILEAAEDNPMGARQGGKTPLFQPKGFGSTSAIRGVGLVNREREDRYEFNPNAASADQHSAQAEMRQLEKDYFRRMATIFGIINKDSSLKKQGENIVAEYANNLRTAQALKQRISRNINSNLKTVLVRPGESDVIGAKDLPRGDSDTSVREIDKKSDHAKDLDFSEKIMSWLETNDHKVYEEFVDFACEATAPTLVEMKLQSIKDKIAAYRLKGEAVPEELSVETDHTELMEKASAKVREILEHWYHLKSEAYERGKEQYVRGGRGMLYGVNTPVSSLIQWLNSATATIGRDQERAERDVITHNSSAKVIGNIALLPEGGKIKQLLDIVDTARHGFAKAAEGTSRFYQPGRDKDEDEKVQKSSFKATQEYHKLETDAYQIVSDLSNILGSKQFPLFQLLSSFFNEEPGAEGALVNFILNDVVKSFNS